MASSDLMPINIAQININGLQSKMDHIKQLLEDDDIDILCVNETKTCGEEGDVIEVDGYTLYRNDRDGCTSGRDGGGVAMYINDQIEFTKIRKSRSVESLWVEIDAPGRITVALGTMYRAPSEDDEYFKKMKRDIKRVQDGERCILLLGDLNYNYLDDRINENVEDIEDTFGLSQIVTEPTRGLSLLDVVLTDLEQYLDEPDVQRVSYSDHNVVMTSLDIATCDICRKTFKGKRGVASHKRQKHPYGYGHTSPTTGHVPTSNWLTY